MYVERNSVYNVIEKLAGHGIHCLPCYDTSDIIELLNPIATMELPGFVLSACQNEV